MKKISKAAAVGLSVIMSAGLLAGCGSSASSANSSSVTSASGTAASGDQVTIKFIHKFPEDARMQYFNEVVADFEKANPDIKIEMTAYGDEEIKDKTRVLLGGSEAPDIYFTWSGERLQNFVDAGNALDISSYLDDDSDWKKSFNEAMLNTCIKNDGYYAIPWDFSSKELIYNKQIFADADITDTPKTWDELLEDCEKIKATGITPIAIGNQYPWVICHYLTTLNGKLVPKDTLDKNYTLEDADFSDAGYAEALDMVKELYDKGYINSDANSATWEMSQSMVQEGTAAMIYEEVQNVINYDKALGTENWGYFDFPEIDGEKGEAGYITGGPDLFVVNADTKYPEQCIRFLKYLTSDEVQSKMVYDLGFLPTTTVELDESKCVPNEPEIIKKNLEAPGVSEWLDCVLDQTVSQTYLEGCQSIFGGDDGKTIMANVTETAKEVKADE